MITLEAEEKNILIEIPEHWDEMTGAQAHYCLKLAAKMLAGKISEDYFRLKCFYKLSGIKRNWRSVMWEKLVSEEKLLQKNANAWQLSQKLTDFMFKEQEAKEGEEAKKEFAYETVINFFPQFKASGTRFYGPAVLLTDLTFGEFRAAIEELNTYFQNKEEHQLSRLFSVLYRPARKDFKQWQKSPDYDGRFKEPFNRNHLDKYAKKLDKLSGWQRMAMLLHFTWCINYIKSEDLEIEGRIINFSPIFPKSKEDDNTAVKPSIGWTGVLFGIAEKGIFGDVKKTDEASLFDVLLYMYDNYLQGEEIKRLSQKRKK